MHIRKTALHIFKTGTGTGTSTHTLLPLCWNTSVKTPLSLCCQLSSLTAFSFISQTQTRPATMNLTLQNKVHRTVPRTASRAFLVANRTQRLILSHAKKLPRLFWNFLKLTSWVEVLSERVDMGRGKHWPVLLWIHVGTHLGPSHLPVSS